MHTDSAIEIQSLPLIHQGKVRDMYDAGDQRLLIVASDRVSAFDVILPNVLVGKGKALTTISNFWFDLTKPIINNHCLEDTIVDLVSEEEYQAIAGKAVLAKRLKPLAIEAVVRGYLVGSGWKDYQQTGQVCGIQLPEGLQQASQLPEPIYTPATKAAVGEHDENIDYETTIDIVGEEMAAQVKRVSLELYRYASEYASKKGIIIADSKFEFGLDELGELVLMDELFTPDSSRFWDRKEYQVGISPPSFDKQIIRDYLQGLDWDQSPPGPELPASILEKTLARYNQVIDLLKS